MGGQAVVISGEGSLEGLREDVGILGMEEDESHL